MAALPAARAAAVAWLLLALAASAAGAGSNSPAPAPAPAMDCIAAASSLIDCMGYVSPDSSEKSPSRACCGEVKTAVANPSVVDCLCSLAGSKNLGIPIDMKRVTSLPGACGASNFVSSKCNTERHRSSHGTHRSPRRRRRRRGVPPPRARLLRRGEGLALPCPGAGGGLHRGRRGPGRLPQLRLPGEHGEEPVQDLLRGGQDRRGQSRRRRLPLLPRGQQEPGLTHRHETRARAPRRLRLVQHRLQQVPHFRGFSCRSTWSVYRGITERRSDRIPAESRGELSDDGNRPRGRRGGTAARLLLPALS